MTINQYRHSEPEPEQPKEVAPLLQRFAEAFRAWTKAPEDSDQNEVMNCWRLLDEYDDQVRADVEKLVTIQPVTSHTNALQVLAADRDEWKKRAMANTVLPNGWPMPYFMYTTPDGSFNVEWQDKDDTCVSFFWDPDEGAMVMRTGPDGDSTDEGPELAKRLDEWLKPKGRQDEGSGSDDGTAGVAKWATSTAENNHIHISKKR